MEIPGKKPLIALPAHHRFMDDTQTAPSSVPGMQNSEKDVVALSENARTIRETGRVASRLPDISEDKVAAMKRRIEAGTYRVSGEQIASSLIRETMENNDILNHIDTNA